MALLPFSTLARRSDVRHPWGTGRPAADEVAPLVGGVDGAAVPVEAGAAVGGAAVADVAGDDVGGEEAEPQAATRTAAAARSTAVVAVRDDAGRGRPLRLMAARSPSRTSRVTGVGQGV
jgi:hypothetical protein